MRADGIVETTHRTETAMSLIDADEPPLFDIATIDEPDDDTGGDKGGG